MTRVVSLSPHSGAMVLGETGTIQERIEHLVTSPCFHYCVGVSIFANFLFSMLRAELRWHLLLKEGPQAKEAEIMWFLDGFFNFLFVTEVMLRIFAFGRRFFQPTTPGVYWNAMDLLLVGMALGDILWTMQGVQVRFLGMSTFVRLLRIVRLGKIFHHLLVRQAGREISVIFRGLSSCFRVVLLSAIPFALIVILFAVAFQDAVNGMLIEAPGDIAEQLTFRFGGMYQTMGTLYKAATGGLVWDEVATTLWQVDPIYAQLLGFFTAVMTAYLQLTVATMVVAFTVETPNSHLAVAQKEMSHPKSHMMVMREILQMNSKASTPGRISLDDLLCCISDPSDGVLFEGWNIHATEAEGLFRLLDFHSDPMGEISINEFVFSCFQLKYNNVVDLPTLLQENRRMMRTWIEFMCYVEEEFETTKKVVGLAARGSLSMATARKLTTTKTEHSSWLATNRVTTFSNSESSL